jgi:F-type H+-transporting ATPase subunit delta
MAEIATIARPYAEAAFRVAQKGDLNAWDAYVSGLAAIARDPAMKGLVSNPKIDDSTVYSVFMAVLRRTLSPEEENFLKTLIDNRRLEAMSEIATQFRLLKDAQEGNAVAEVATAFELSDLQLKDLLSGLETKFGIKLKPNVVLDRSLIGGVKVTVGDRVLDSSVRARLEQMRVALTT